MIRSSLITFVVALLLLFGALVVYVFWYSIVRDASIRTAELAASIEARSDASLRARAAEEAMRALEREHIVFDAYLISSEDIVSFLERLEETGRSLGAQTNVVSVSGGTEGELPRFSVSVTFSGSFDSVLRTVGAIEHGPYDLSTASLSMHQLSTDDGAVWNASVVFSVGAREAGVPSAAPASEDTEVSQDAVLP